MKCLIVAVVPCIAVYELISAFSFGVYFWYVPHLVDFLGDSEAFVLFSSFVTYLLAASIQEDGICNERCPVGLGKITFEGLDFLKLANKAIISYLTPQINLHSWHAACGKLHTLKFEITM